MRTITFEEADPLLSWTKLADAIEAGHHLPKAKIGDLLLQNAPNALLTRGAWIEGMGMLVKSMSVFPGNDTSPTVQGGVMLFDGDNGMIKAVIDGILLTKWKTAGDSVLGARLLANPEPKVHLVAGAGTVASSILDAYSAVFPSIEKFIIWNRNRGRAAELAKSKTLLTNSIEISDNLEQACAEADIITTATMATEPVLYGQWIKPGTHIDLIGAYKPNMREADDALLQKSELFVDSRDTTLGHIGEIDIPLKSGAIAKTDILGDFYDICTGKTGRNCEESISLFKNGGGAHLDLMTAQMILDSIKQRNL